MNAQTEQNSTHTPGPWMAAARPSSVVGWPVVSPAAMGRSICSVTVGHGESAANARLIAAAPELLDALIAADGLLRELGHSLPQVKAVLAKAAQS